MKAVMDVKLIVGRLNNGGIQVTVSGLEQKLTSSREYITGKKARGVLLHIGVPKNALDFYFSQLLPRLQTGQELSFPVMDMLEERLREYCLFKS